MNKLKLFSIIITLSLISGFMIFVITDTIDKKEKTLESYNITKNHVILEIKENMSTEEKLKIIKANCEVYYKTFSITDNKIICENSLKKEIFK